MATIDLKSWFLIVLLLRVEQYQSPIKVNKLHSQGGKMEIEMKTIICLITLQLTLHGAMAFVVTFNKDCLGIRS